MSDIPKILNSFYKVISAKILIDLPVKKVSQVFNSAYVNEGVERKIKRVFKKAGIDTKMAKDPLHKAEVISFIEDKLIHLHRWSTSITEIVDKGLLKGDVAKDILKVYENARATIVGDKTGVYKRYKQQVNKRIDKLVSGDTSRLKRAYKDIIELTESSTQKQFDNAIKYAIKEKARYNAERIFITERTRVVADETIQEANEDKDVVALKWHLSPREYCATCRMYATQNFCGMGIAIYPKNEAPECPAHPNCNCRLKPVYKTEIKNENGKWSKSRTQKIFNSLSKKDKKLVILKNIKGKKYRKE
jgi:hypothetical protein